MRMFQSEHFTNEQSLDARVPPEDPKAVRNFVSNCVIDSDVYRNKFSVLSESKSWVQDANKYEDLYNGKLYSKREKLPHECKEDLYRDAVDFNMSLLTQFEVKDSVKKITEEAGSIEEETLARIVNYCFEELNDGKEKEEDLVQIGGQMGVGIYYFDPIEVDDGYIWPGHELVDPRQFGISPGASTIQKAAWCFWKRPVPTYELKVKFPEFAEVIKADIDVSEISGKGQTSSDGSVLVDGLGTAAYIGMNAVSNFFSGKDQKNQTNLTEFYYKDPQIMKITSEPELEQWIDSNPGFGSKFFRDTVKQTYLKRLADGELTVKRFPFGRKIMVIKDVVLMDKPNPYPFFPFDGFKCYKRPKQFWAKGVIEIIREPVQNIQLMTAGMAANLDYRLRNSYYCQTNSPAALKSKKVPTDPNTVEAFPGPLMAIPVGQVAPPDVMNLVAFRTKQYQNTAGLDPILGGNNPTGNYSGVQTNALMEAALGKTAIRLRSLNRTRKGLGEKYLWFIRNYCTDERVIQFQSDDEQIMTIQMNQMVPDQSGNPVIKNDVTKGNYKYFVDVNITQPASPSQAFAQVQGIAKIMAPFAPIEAARIQLEKAPITQKFTYLRRFEEAIKSKQEQDVRKEMMQSQIQAAEIALKHKNELRKLDIEEVKAGASAQESLAWVIQALTKTVVDAQTTGVQLPPELMNEIRVLAGTTSEQATQADALSAPAVQPPLQPGNNGMPNLPGQEQ